MSVMEENWYNQLDLYSIEHSSFKEYEINVKCLHQHTLDLLQDSFKMQKYYFNGNLAQSHDNELKTIMEQNSQLRHEIETKLEELSKQKLHYELYKKDQKMLSQEIKETHEAFLMAKKYYKRFLKMYFTIESRNDSTQIIYLQFFTEAKRESDNFSLKLLRDLKTGHYELINVVPKLPTLKDLKTQLQETHDVPGVLCCIRQIFMNLKRKKN